MKNKFADPIGHIDERPWGRYHVLDQGDGFQVKRMEVEPHKRLSLQSHKYREEFWIVVNGILTVQLDDEIKDYKPGDVVHIKIGVKHRPENKTDKKITFIEVWQGEILDEHGDITRYEDDYGRD